MNKSIFVIILSVVSIVGLTISVPAQDLSKDLNIKTVSGLGDGELDQSQEVSNAVFEIGKLYQTFNASDGNKILSKVDVKFIRGNQDVDITLSVHDDSDFTDSTCLSLINLNSENIDEDGWLEFDLDDCAVYENMRCYILIELKEGDRISICGSNSDTYENGKAMFYDPELDGWVRAPNHGFNLYDLAFRTYGYDAEDPVADFTFEDSDGYGSGTTMNFDASSSADSDGQVVEYQWWFNKKWVDYDLGEPDLITTEPVCTHTYDDELTSDHYVTLKAIDDLGLFDLEYNEIRVWVSAPPTKPTITGPTDGNPDVEYTFEINSTDPDGDQLEYLCILNNGQGETEEKIPLGPADSNEKVSFTRSFSSTGTYNLRVSVKDSHGTYWDDDGDRFSRFNIEIKKDDSRFLASSSIFAKLISLFPLLKDILNF